MEILPPYDKIGVTPTPPFVNANPSAGVTGSIVNAEVFNALQNEIVNVQGGAGLSQDPDDYTQLYQAIRSGLLAYYVDTGVANAPIITPANPAVTAFVDGMRFRIKMKAAPTGASVLHVNALTAPIVRRNNLALVGGEWHPDDIIDLVYKSDEGAFQIAGLTVPDIALNFQALLSAGAVYYVNAATGNDGNSGLSADAPFATIQKAVDVVAGFNLNSQPVTINVADGTYGAFTVPSFIGGSVSLVGNTASPGNVVISNNTGGSAIRIAGASILEISGFSVEASAAGTGGDQGWGIDIFGDGSRVVLRNINFGFCYGGWLEVVDGTSCSIGTAVSVSGGTNSAPGFDVQSSGLINNVVGETPPTLDITAAVSVSAFISAENNGTAALKFSSITGAANLTGQRYIAFANGVINTQGGGASYYPGTTDGATSTGGQYL